MNSITEYASIDQCVDKTLGPHMGFGTEVLHRLVGKPGVNEGGIHEPTAIGTVCNHKILL
eukprot:9576698-Ditylum_brightwellii.AAC.1